MSPGTREGGEVTDSRTTGDSSVSSALCLHPKRGDAESEGMHFASSLDRVSSVGHRNQRNFRGSQRQDRRRQKWTGRMPTSFPWLKALGPALILLCLKFTKWPSVNIPFLKQSFLLSPCSLSCSSFYQISFLYLKSVSSLFLAFLFFPLFLVAP